MRFAILGDIHSNLEALNTVLADAQSENVTSFICVGDVVGYNPNPKECLAWVKQNNIPCVKGNHDESVSREDDLTGFNPLAAEVVRWQRQHLDDDDKKFLRELKLIRYVQNFCIVHATLDTPHKWGYVFDRFQAAASFTYQNTAVCFFGHTHVPLAFVRDTTVKGGTYTKIPIEPGRKYFINVGSVGQPRDGDARAAYVIYDTDKKLVELKRLEYDYRITQQKIYDAGLPSRLAERLALGK